MSRSWDHPRSRGVYLTETFGADFFGGSSPLARGLRAMRRVGSFDTRIIPARAGFTAGEYLDMAVGMDHPRSRGVYVPRPLKRARTGGSSPLARGLPDPARRVDRRPRIIPARAGFTSVIMSRAATLKDHPRSRGVYIPPRTTGSCGIGSSPLARGLRRPSHTQINRSGIIPARAGFTGRWRSRGPKPWDHPRSRGVYPPHRLSSGTRADHPRSRGVYVASAWKCAVMTGSSPLARGLLRAIGHRRDLNRIIPARAGFTARNRSSP